MIRETVKDWLLIQRGQWNKVQAVSGISADWMSKFIRGERPNAHVSKFEKLLDAMYPEGWEIVSKQPNQEHQKNA